MFDNERRSATVETLEETEVIAILGGDMRRLLREHPDIAVKLIAALGRRLRETNERLARQSFQTVQSRVAAVLAQLVAAGARARAPATADVLITATQADLAQLAGSSRESASRFLAVLERAGIITQGRGKLVVHDPGGARAIRLLARARPSEFSAGGVVVRGDEVVVIVPVKRDARREPRARVCRRAIPTATRPPSRRPRARSARRPGSTAELIEKLGEVSYSLRATGAPGRQAGAPSTCSSTAPATSPTTITRSRRRGGCR